MKWIYFERAIILSKKEPRAVVATDLQDISEPLAVNFVASPLESWLSDMNFRVQMRPQTIEYFRI
jgi:hypothetical protein